MAGSQREKLKPRTKGSTRC
ncbi:unnamed protein product [Arabidopsis thaliana]|uniref:Uncharacterized protein At2g25990 n=2 Tax=Arabidopsis thaliana TaxID=3702 RepID=O80997_ARATH|nr:uncharacterized protein AT2G25990 [Arabidopsis thaliana]AAC31236.1 unknown protein [Arabidopsis thaliana]AEC07780.1 hypothetical protein AT2G25990 [Arabidopsis thaliana]CAA0371897.1 unnamed protein product [Arabidopsis thaliana]VYS53533.1 unnamed protein product [Arabidopsis thaliana]|eukprot:NP_001336501.1 hypothetical protein AT2G25990 [Arabidopsis thaliana]